jgi:hypothetical protein
MRLDITARGRTLSVLMGGHAKIEGQIGSGTKAMGKRESGMEILHLLSFFSIRGIFVFARFWLRFVTVAPFTERLQRRWMRRAKEEQGTGWRGEEQKEKDITLLDRTGKAEDTAKAERCATLDGIRAVDIVVEDKHELPGYSE